MYFDHMILAEKWRPTTVQDCILPTKVKADFQGYVDDKMIPNLILVGSSGVGKTSVAEAALKEIGADYLKVNGSLNLNMDKLRTDISQYASSVSLVGGRKYVLIDEGDNLHETVQLAFRAFVEEFAVNCGFIITGNYLTKLRHSIQSRVAVIEFAIPAAEKAQLMKEQFQRAKKILEAEGIPYEERAVAGFVQKYFPDFRKFLNEIQAIKRSGVTMEALQAADASADWKVLYKALKTKNFTEVRKWVGTSSAESRVIYRRLFEDLQPLLVPDSIPTLILTIADYQHRAAFVADQEINTTACLVTLMAELTWR